MKTDHISIWFDYVNDPNATVNALSDICRVYMKGNSAQQKSYAYLLCSVL